MAIQGHARGSLIVHMRSHIEARDGPQGWARLLEQAPTADREQLQALVVSNEWVPVGVWNRILRAHLAAVSVGADAEMRAIAFSVADADLHTVFKLMLRLATPEAILRRAGTLWSRYFDRGTLQAREEGAREWALRLDAPTDEEEGASEPICAHGVGGWLTQALRLAGAPHSAIAHTRCRFGFGHHCEYRVTW